MHVILCFYFRRFEDPEYSRGGGLGGPNDRYEHNRPLSRGRLGDRPRSRERSAGRPDEYGPRSSNRPNDMIYDRQSDWPLERHVDGPNYGTENKPMERPGTARPMDRHIDQPGDRQMNRPWERLYEGPI